MSALEWELRAYPRTTLEVSSGRESLNYQRVMGRAVKSQDRQGPGRCRLSAKRIGFASKNCHSGSVTRVIARIGNLSHNLWFHSVPLTSLKKPMVNQQIEKVKQEYTDKYVVVDAQCPELARFSELVGQVKTVNMSGRALVEFGDYHKNIAWYDIDLDYLKVVDKPADRKSTRLNSSHTDISRMPSSA